MNNPNNMNKNISFQEMTNENISLQEEEYEDDIKIILEDAPQEMKSLPPSPASSTSSSSSTNTKKWKKLPFSYESTSPVKSFHMQHQQQSQPQQSQRQSNLYSRFCQNMAKDGICTYSACTFAHTIEQYSPLKCKADRRCGNMRCNFWHSFESIHQYIHRCGIQVPERIQFESVMEKSKNYGREQALAYKEKPTTSQIKLETCLMRMPNDVAHLHHLGYKNINLILNDTTTVSKFTVEMITDYVDYLNTKVHNLSTLSNEDRFKLHFSLPDISKYIKEIRIVNGPVHQVNADILGDVNGWTLVNKVGELCSKCVGESTFKIRAIQIDDYQPGVSVEMSVVVDLF